MLHFAVSYAILALEVTTAQALGQLKSKAKRPSPLLTDFLSLNDSLFNSAPQALSGLFLVAVVTSAVKEAVASFESSDDGLGAGCLVDFPKPKAEQDCFIKT